MKNPDKAIPKRRVRYRKTSEKVIEFLMAQQNPLW